MIHYLIVPGLGNSGQGHWQSIFEQSGPEFTMIEQDEWDAPDATAWIKRIDDTVIQYPLTEVVLIGHSLGCIAIALWAQKYKRSIRGALLVAPSDAEAPAYTFPSTGFDKVPLEKINFETIVVASNNDEWVSMERAKYFASNWGSKLINIGDAGHVNVAAGFGNWPEGLAMLQQFETDQT